MQIRFHLKWELKCIAKTWLEHERTPTSDKAVGISRLGLDDLSISHAWFELDNGNERESGRFPRRCQTGSSSSVPQEKRASKLFSGPERAGRNGSKRELWFLSGFVHSCKCHEQCQWCLNFTAQARRRQLSFNAEAVRMTYRPAINSSQTQLLCQDQRRWNSQNFSKTCLGHISLLLFTFTPKINIYIFWG